MNPMRKRWLIRLAILLIVGLIALFWSVGQLGRNLTIENRSEQAIEELKITLGDQTQTFHNIKPGQEVSVPLPSSGAFAVDVRLPGDKLLRLRGSIRDNLHYELLPGGQLQQQRRKGWFR